MEQSGSHSPSPITPYMGVVSLFRILGYLVAEHWQLATAKYFPKSVLVTYHQKCLGTNAVVAEGLSVKQSMMVIVIGRLLISLFSCLIAWAGFNWHIGFTVQNRYTWGLRGSYIPLMQRVLLNFIWTAYQCWTGGRLIAVALTAIWPSYANIPNGFSADFPTTTPQFLGFFLFWLFSLQFLLVRPEKFKIPFQIICAWCALNMISMCTYHTLGYRLGIS